MKLFYNRLLVPLCSEIDPYKDIPLMIIMYKICICFNFIYQVVTFPAINTLIKGALPFELIS